MAEGRIPSVYEHAVLNIVKTIRRFCTGDCFTPSVESVSVRLKFVRIAWMHYSQ